MIFGFLHPFFIMLSLALSSLNAFAANSGVTYQGRILRPDGTPLAGAAVQFKMQIRTPDGNDCLMYEESKAALDMRNSNGVFSVTMNDGTGARTSLLIADGAAAPTTISVDRIFANRGSFTFDASTCTGSNTYATNSSDGRNLVVLFKDETMSSWEPVPSQKINFVPFAFEAKQVAGFTPTSLVRVAELDGTLGSVSPISNAEYTKLLSLAQTPVTSGQVVGWNGSSWTSVDPQAGIQTFAKTALPGCAAGEFLRGASGVLSCATPPATSGTVTRVDTGTGLTGGGFTTTGTISISAGGVTATELAASAVTTAKIAGGAVDSTKLAADAVTTVKIANGAIDSTKIAADAVTSAKILDGTITGSDLANNISVNTSGTLSSRGLTIYPNPTGSFGVSFAAPAGLASNYALTWPLAQSTGAQVLQNDGSGNLSWTSLSAASPWITQSPGINYMSGNVGIGTTSPTERLHVNGNQRVSGHSAVGSTADVDPTISGETFKSVLNVNDTVTSVSTDYVEGITNYLSFNPAANSATAVYGADTFVSTPAGNVSNVASLNGSFSSSAHNGTGTVNRLSGVEGYALNRSTGTITNAVGAEFAVTNNGAGVISNAHGLKTSVNRASGTITNGYGIYVGPVQSVNKWSIYATDAAAPSYFAGNVGIGTTSPVYKLDVNGAVNATSLKINGVDVSAGGMTSLTGDVTGAGSGAVATTIASNAVTTSKISNASVILAKLAADSVDSTKIVDGSVATADLAAAAVTYSKLQNISTNNRLLGRASAGAGVTEEITLGTGLALSGTTLNNTVTDTDTFAAVTAACANTFVPYKSGGVWTCLQAIDTNTNSTLVSRDASGNFASNVATVNGLALKNAGSVLNLVNPVGGAWTMTLPATAGSASQVLTTNGSGVTSWTTPTTGTFSQWTTQAPGINYMSGNVGIGTTSPTFKFDVTGSGRIMSGGTPKGITSGVYGLTVEHNGYPALFLVDNSAANRNFGLSQDGTGNLKISSFTDASVETSIMRMTPSGNVGVGINGPSAVLQIKAGTTDAGTAPLKFTAGPVMSTPENGAVEYDGATLFLTSGGVRRVIPSTTSSNDFSNVGSITGSGALTVAAGGTNQNLTLSGTGTGSVTTGSIFNVTNSTASTSSSTGAAVVSGGLGVGGNINSGGAVSAVTGYMPQVYGSKTSAGDIRIDGTDHATKGNVLLATAGGNVGVGTPGAPATKLEVSSSTAGSAIVRIMDFSYGAPSAVTPTLQFGAAVNNGFVTGDGAKIWLQSTAGNFADLRFNVNQSSPVMVMQNTGNVGIGTTAPGQRLEVAGIAKAGAFVVPNSNGYFFDEAGQNGTYIYGTTSSTPNILTLNTTGTERLRINASGNVGIGTTSPLATLDIQANSPTMRLIGSSTASIQTTYANSGGGFTYVGVESAAGGNLSIGSLPYAAILASSSNAVQMGAGGQVRQTILGNGNVGIGTTAPGAPLDVKGAIRMSGSTSGYTGFQPASAAGSTVWTLPTADGSSGQVLSTSGAGILSWITPSGGGMTSLTGDVTGSGSGAVATTIAANAITSAKIADGTIAAADLANKSVTLAKMDDIATAKLIGRSTAGTGVPEVISIGTGLSLSSGTLANTVTDTDTFAPVTAACANTFVPYKSGLSWSCMQVISSNTASTIVQRDASGNFSSNVATLNGVTLNNGGSLLNIVNPIGGAWNMTLPPTAGSASQVLTTDGSGVLSWTTPATGGGSTLGTSPTATSPSRSGEAGTGVYTSASNTLNLAIGGTKAYEAANNTHTFYSGTQSAMQLAFTRLSLKPISAYPNGIDMESTFVNGFNSSHSSMITVSRVPDNSTGQNLLTIGTTRVNSTSLSGLTLPAGSFNAIRFERDGGPSSSTSTPGQIFFDTTPSGSATLLTRMTIRADGNVGIGTTSPISKLDVTGSIRASGQMSSGSQTISGGTTAIDWDNGNAISTDYNCNNPLTFANLRDGGTYTLVATSTATTACNFATSTTGIGAGTVSYRFKPANAARTASSHSIYTLMRVGTVVYVSWTSGF